MSQYVTGNIIGIDGGSAAVGFVPVGLVPVVPLA